MNTIFHNTNIVPNYTLHGTGDKHVIVLHDWMGDTEGNWKFALEYIDTAQFTYALVDVRGYGKSKELLGEFTIDEIASDIFALADKLRWEKFYLVGHSMGGMASQKAVLQDKNQRIQAVVCITPVSSAGFPTDAETESFFRKMITDPESAYKGYGMLVNDKLPSSWNQQRAERWHSLTNPKAVNAYMDQWQSQNFYEETKGIQLPFLVIYGEDDLEPWQEEGQKNAFQHFKNVSFTGITNAGHYPMQQVPAYTVRLIESFLTQH